MVNNNLIEKNGSTQGKGSEFKAQQIKDKYEKALDKALKKVEMKLFILSLSNGEHNENSSDLMWALVLKTGNTKMAELLIEKGADVNFKDEAGTALIWAVDSTSIEIVELLIEKGADLNVQNKDGWTALMWATNKGNTKIAELLIGKGADLNVQEYKGKTALDIAIENNNKEMIALLESKSKSVN